MIFVHQDLIGRARAATSAADVVAALEGAIQLELSTVPPYLTGLFSLKPEANEAVRALVHSVVMEEMLHLSLAANTAIALGGEPRVRALGLALHYPGPLPMAVDPELTVGLASLTVAQVRDVFMAIERPDTTAVLPGEDPAIAQRVADRKQQGYASIGDFYAAIIAAIERLAASGDDPFADPRLDRQLDLARWFPVSVPGNPTCRVHDLATAKGALDTIVRQGEGVDVGRDPIRPFASATGAGELAHYFRFGEIAAGRRLVADAKDPSGWSFTGAPVPLDLADVFAFPTNARVADYAPQSAAGLAAAAFYDAYLRLLGALDATFTGRPAAFSAALGLMFELKLVAQQVVQHPAAPKGPPGLVAAPPFQP